MRWSLPAQAIHRPITTMMVVVTLLGLGAIAYHLIPVEFISNSDMPMVSCWIPYPGSSPSQVEKEIAVPAEGMFLTVPRIKHIRTTSEDYGCYVYMEFDWETDMVQATAEIRDRSERLRLLLPSDVERLYLFRWGDNNAVVMWLGLFRGRDREAMAHLVRTQLKPRLERIEGVAEIGVQGEGSADVYIEFDQNALRSRNLSLYEIVAALRTSNINVSVGRLMNGETRHYVRVMGEFTKLKDIEDIVVGPNCTRVKDVATVTMHGPPHDWEFTMDRQRGVFLSVKKESQANTVAVCDAVRAELAQVLKDPAFHGVKQRIFHDQSEMIKATLSSLVRSGQYGSILSLAVLFIFLRRVRATVLVALMIPASLVAALIYMYFTHISLNIVTMSSMIVSLGMLVDNAIVVIENIHRYHEFNPDPVECARLGSEEVGLAITAATLTTIVVFIPVLYMNMGMMSIYMRQFASPVSVSLFASLILALTVIPLAASRILQRESRHFMIPGPLGRALERLRSIRFFDRVMSSYVYLLDFVIHRRLAALVLLAGLLAVTIMVPVHSVGMQQMPTLDSREVNIYARFEQSYGLDRTRETFAAMETALDEVREALGIESIFIQQGLWGGNISVFLAKPGERETPLYKTEEVRDILARKLPDKVPGAELYFGVERGGAAKTQSIWLSMRGDDADLVEEYAEKFATMMRSIPQVVDCRTNREMPKPEIQLKIDENLASKMGLNPTVVARTVDFALRGAMLPYVKMEGREIPLHAQFQEIDRNTRADLDNVALMTPTGKLVSLNDIVATEKAYTPRSLEREDGKSVRQISVEVSTEDMGAVSASLKELASTFVLPRGYSLDMGTMLQEMDESEKSFKGALILAIVLIYLLMAALFESFLLPVSILTSVPLAFVGVYWMMYTTDTPLDTVALIGGVLMCGVIVNNGIVIIDHINQLRTKHGLGRHEAILQGGRDRLRPVLMTALTTVLGCVPLAIGQKTGEDLLYSMGRALVGGLAMGTLLTLFVVPMFYSLIDDLRCWFVSFRGSLALARPAKRYAVDSQSSS